MLTGTFCPFIASKQYKVKSYFPGTMYKQHRAEFS